MSNRKLVEIKDLTKKFKMSRGRYLHAVDGVSLDIFEGEILGLVGESGCGKSTLGRLVIKLHDETSGSIIFEGAPYSGRLGGQARRDFAQKVQLIFQDPYSSLNPRMTVRDIVAEGPRALGTWKRSEEDAKVTYWLEKVGLHRSHGSRYPHEFSGGQRQRIGIARALAVGPKLIICDEPISALDVSVQAQIVNLLKAIQKDQELTYLFIAHDLSMVRVICDRMAVMYLGKIVEVGTSRQVYESPQHPYTQALIAANPIPDPIAERQRERRLIEGEIGSPINPKPGCPFAPRCPHTMAICRTTTPLPTVIASGHQAACHLLSNGQAPS